MQYRKWRPGGGHWITPVIFRLAFCILALLAFLVVAEGLLSMCLSAQDVAIWRKL